MGSSGSTPNPPRRRVPRLLLSVAGDDDPRACTGLKLLRLGRATRVGHAERHHPPPIVLDPYARVPLTRADTGAAVRGGILAVDCSWNRLARRGAAAPSRPRAKEVPTARRLPYLLAANPQHFGRVGELNTVEALAAALYLLGFAEEAARLLEGFRGGPAFLDLNREALALFAPADRPDALCALERAFYGGSDRRGGPSSTD